jgi:hypothetical protein
MEANKVLKEVPLATFSVLTLGLLIKVDLMFF